MPTQRVAAPGASEGVASGWTGLSQALTGHAHQLAGFLALPSHCLEVGRLVSYPEAIVCGAESAPLAVYGAQLSMPCRSFPGLVAVR